jgi:hypothetical protein
MSEGYTHTTLSAHPGEPVRVQVSFYLDYHAWIAACGSENGRPHLAVSHGDVAVSIAPARCGEVTAEDARIARELADEAAKYAAEVERLAAASDSSAAA